MGKSTRKGKGTSTDKGTGNVKGRVEVRVRVWVRALLGARVWVLGRKCRGMGGVKGGGKGVRERCVTYTCRTSGVDRQTDSNTIRQAGRVLCWSTLHIVAKCKI